VAEGVNPRTPWPATSLFFDVQSRLNVIGQRDSGIHTATHLSLCEILPEDAFSHCRIIKLPDQNHINYRTRKRA